MEEMLLRIDTHVHTTNSPDGSIEAGEIPQILRSKSLDGVAVTDHDRFFDQEIDGIIVIPGIEVSTKQGHLLGLGNVGEIDTGLSVDETVRIIRSRGGVAIIAHPYDVIRGGIKPEQVAEKLDGIETINSKAHPYSLSKHLAEKAAQRLNVPMFGGSDSHTPDTIGDAYTCVESRSGSVADILNGLKRGRVYARGGPSGSIKQLRRVGASIRRRL